MKNLRHLFSSRKRVLVLSPHPDDDCIGIGATLSFLRERNNCIKILYLTSGWRGVKGDFSQEEKNNLRKREAISACQILGINRKSLKFLSLPFYDKGRVSSEDVKILTGEIERFHPQIIFTCGAENDPHSTHKKCWKIIRKSLENLDFSPQVYLYRVWSYFKKIDFFFPFEERLMERKIEAIQVHKSQLKPRYTKEKIFSFSEWEERLNKNYGDKLRKYKKLKDKKFLFAEVFKTCPENPEKNCNFRKEKRYVYKIMD